METLKLKMKIGEHEFDAEGPTDVVQAQFVAFKELISSLPEKRQESPSATSKEGNAGGQMPHLPLEKILKVEGRVISLTAKCETVDEAVLLILLGQKESRRQPGGDWC